MSRHVVRRLEVVARQGQRAVGGASLAARLALFGADWKRIPFRRCEGNRLVARKCTAAAAGDGHDGLRRGFGDVDVNESVDVRLFDGFDVREPETEPLASEVHLFRVLAIECKCAAHGSV